MTPTTPLPRAIMILTGAGMSAESGMGTFRDTEGVWAKFDPAELATPEAFARNPEKVQDFYNKRRADLLTAQPNAAHIALAKLETHLIATGATLTIVTQNIDDLHERAGSHNVLHMHGELRKARCETPRGGCAGVSPWDDDLSAQTPCPQCRQKGHMRPHVVWFHEMPLYLDQIDALMDDVDMFVSIGTSGTVWPAAGFVMEARSRGAQTLELNLEPSDGGAIFDQALYGPATQLVPQWVTSLGVPLEG